MPFVLVSVLRKLVMFRRFVEADVGVGVGLGEGAGVGGVAKPPPGSMV